MKKRLFLAAASSILLFTGCEELENLCGISADDLGFTEDYTHHLNAAIYVYQQSDRALKDEDLELNGTAVIDGANCTRTQDSLIVDFGNGTVGADGIVRRGSYRMGLIGDYNTPGGKASLVLKNYFSEDELYTGNLNIENVTPSGSTQPNYNFGVSNFALDSIALNGNLTANWLVGHNTASTADDDFELGGGAVLENTNSLSTYTGAINVPILISTACDYTFVSGNISLVPSDDALPSVIIDFLDGDCANLYKAKIDCEGNEFSFSLPIQK